MKIENLKRANQLQQQLNNVTAALFETEMFLSKKKRDIPGHVQPKEGDLYQLHISEFGDGSGFGINLSNCEIGIEVVKSVIPLLKAKKAEIEAEIATL